MSKKDTRARNWKHYNKSLVQRGSITLWVDPNCFSLSTPHKGRGRPRQYPDQFIQAGLVLKNVYQLPFRALEGFLTSVLTLMSISVTAPNYTTLCRRQKGLIPPSLISKARRHTKKVIVVDSTGLKVYGEGEWCVKKHKKQYQRTWRKLHLAVDGDTLQVLSCKLSSARTQDGSLLEALLEDIPGELDTVIGDGAYDTFGCYEAVHARGGKAVFPPPERARLSLETPYHRKAASLGAIEQRDAHLRCIREVGRTQWKKDVGYHRRSLVETTMYRLKGLLGERFNARLDENRRLEMQIRCLILNTMMENSIDTS